MVNKAMAPLHRMMVNLDICLRIIKTMTPLATLMNMDRARDCKLGNALSGCKECWFLSHSVNWLYICINVWHCNVVRIDISRWILVRHLHPGRIPCGSFHFTVDVEPYTQGAPKNDINMTAQRPVFKVSRTMANPQVLVVSALYYRANKSFLFSCTQFGSSCFVCDSLVVRMKFSPILSWLCSEKQDKKLQGMWVSCLRAFFILATENTIWLRSLGPVCRRWWANLNETAMFTSAGIPI